MAYKRAYILKFIQINIYHKRKKTNSVSFFKAGYYLDKLIYLHRCKSESCRNFPRNSVYLQQKKIDNTY